MALFTVDSNNVFGMGVAEAGTYNVKIVNASLHNSAKGNDYISIDYEVTDGIYKGGQIRYQNVTWDNNDIENSTKRFNSILVAIGIKDGAVIDSLGQLANGLLNRTLSIDVDWAKPNNKGNIYLEVRGYHRLDQSGSKPNGVKRPTSTVTSASHATTADFGGLGAFDRSLASQMPPERNQADTISDDDLPF